MEIRKVYAYNKNRMVYVPRNLDLGKENKIVIMSIDEFKKYEKTKDQAEVEVDSPVSRIKTSKKKEAKTKEEVEDIEDEESVEDEENIEEVDEVPVEPVVPKPVPDKIITKPKLNLRELIARRKLSHGK